MQYAGGIPHQGVPSKHQQQREHLPWHPEGPVESGTNHLQGAAVHLLPADW